MFFINRGINTKSSYAFRECYGKLSEMRSLLSPVPFVALTATASKQVEGVITKSLSMINYEYIGRCPDRNNIRYAVMKVKCKNVKENFKWLINELKEHGQKSTKYLVFCRNHKTVNKCYSTLLNALKEKAHINTEDGKRNFQTRLIAMFHSNTDQQVKDFVMKSFSCNDGIVRVIFATIAFGMGVDCKGLTTVIHYGPSNDIVDYFQESGRAGRGITNVCHALLLLYPGCLSSKLISLEMKQYCKNQTVCRRSLLLRNYGGTVDNHQISRMDCCDICGNEICHDKDESPAN